MEVRRRNKSGGPPVAVIVVVGAAVLGVAAGWWFLLRNDQDAEDMLPVVTMPIADTVSAAAEETVPPLDLPELEAADPFVRDVVSGLSRHPRLASWLVTDDLVHRFVGAVVDMAGGSSPVENLDFMGPEGGFSVREAGGGLVIDEASYRRYDMLQETLTSLDTDGTARLYHQLLPLFEEAFAELGIPDWTFDDTVDRAVENVLAVPVRTGPVPVELDRATYLFEDPDLEGLSPAAKHLLRMGPENLRLTQEKVRALHERIGALTSR